MPLALALLVGSLSLQTPAPQLAEVRSAVRELPAVGGVRIVADGVRRRVLVGDGELFTVYRPDVDPAQPVLYPVLGPGGAPMTRRFPLEAAAEHEATDHPHQRSLWFAHGSINGYDFWAGTQSGDVVAHVAYLPVDAAERDCALRTRDVLVGHDGVIVCTDERYLRFGVDASDGSRWIDVRVTMHADHGPLVFGDTKEGTMAIRMAPTLRLRGPVAQGSVLTSEGVTGPQAWGTRARWVAYWGPIGGESLGLVLMDHPDNPRHPCWWHARDYGLLAANPFGAHDFAGAPPGTGALRVPAGESLTFTYRFRFFRGAADRAALDARYAEFVAAPFPSPLPIPTAATPNREERDR
ncbi:MAG: PmoA family protein [Planctomycetes bacterium]|nr:PmoA family protein [Planctomycetota bacterium]